ncbi:MAG: hypothetical protein KKF77_00215 [Proteobacteria bacterium]|nr:hypothetical protein [Pseudomonadota bacterium]
MMTRSRFTAFLLTGAIAGVLTCSALALPAPALAVSDDPVLKHMDAELEENARLREESWKLHKSGDREAARRTAEALAASEERLERTRAEALAHVSGISTAQVEALRKEGKSWAQASGELGVHPGFLGIGKAPLYESHSTRKARKPKASVQKSTRAKGQTVAKHAATKPKKSKASTAKAQPQAKKKSKSKKQVK